MRFPLRYRVAALTVVCIAPVVAASSVALVRVATDYLWREERDDAVAFAHTLRSATRHAMLTFDRTEVGAIVDAVSREPDVRSVRVYDGRGRRRLPEGQTGPDLDPKSPGCATCHPSPANLAFPPDGCVQRSGASLRLFYPIPNEPACVGPVCHAREERPLGVLEVERDVGPVLRLTRTLITQAGGWGVLVLSAALLPLFFAFTWAFQRPLGECLRLVREVARGNLHARPRLHRSDEWGELLEALDTMAGTVRGARAELESLNRDLEAQVAARTKDLERALDAARASDRMKTEFLAGISHELSTPLQGVIGYADLLLDGIEGELAVEQRRDVEVIRRNGERLLSLVEDLLELARIEAGRRVLCLDRIRLEDVAEAAVAYGRALAGGKAVAVRLVLPEAGPTVVADARALRQALCHLVANAVRHTDEGEVRVEMTHEDGNRVEIVVEDTGVGMEPEVIRSALVGFRPKGGGGGVGIGLTLARRLVELHGGRLTVESAPGAGTRARVGLSASPDGFI